MPEAEILADPITEILLQSTAVLTACGNVDHACRLAGRAYTGKIPVASLRCDNQGKAVVRGRENPVAFALAQRAPGLAWV
jgi:hypothetical protein